MSVGDASVQQSASPPRGLLARHPLISFVNALIGRDILPTESDRSGIGRDRPWKIGGEYDRN